MTAVQQEAAAPGRPRAGEAAGRRGASGYGRRRTRGPLRVATLAVVAVAAAAATAALVSAAEVIAVLGEARLDDPGLRVASGVLLLIGGGMLVTAGASLRAGGAVAEVPVGAADASDSLPGVRKALEESAVTVSGVEAVHVFVGSRSVFVRVVSSMPRKDARRRAVEGAVRARLESLSLGEEFSVQAQVESPGVGA
ncbi:DUF6286 domain-containing protein [Nocardiopsis sp. RSe5-2]|uniref:DUF6286 domain-containing protein n=1 Tax=Nocardiopsis endophytica TaxID=3018445 RepID=A0ABT4UCU9_9ACTN|nr:DUF6286 domain-containing protein [Nocardiopsis endophytica]MDA2814733.1 DUF6286 domain-containing protein [Nocardiopsis endophytica]